MCDTFRNKLTAHQETSFPNHNQSCYTLFANTKNKERDCNIDRRRQVCVISTLWRRCLSSTRKVHKVLLQVCASGELLLEKHTVTHLRQRLVVAAFLPAFARIVQRVHSHDEFAELLEVATLKWECIVQTSNASNYYTFPSSTQHLRFLPIALPYHGHDNTSTSVNCLMCLTVYKGADSSVRPSVRASAQN